MLKSYTRVELPTEYAWELLDCEIELALTTEVKVNLIQRLAELYALGVQYYESHHSYKYLYFQRKMNTLMTSSVLETLPAEQPQQKDKEKEKKNDTVKKMQDELEKKVLYNAGNVDDNKVKEMVRSKEKEVQEWSDKVKRELGKQNERVINKLMQRRQTAQLKMSQSLIELTRHSSESSLQGLNPTPIGKQKIKVDFTNIINENEDEDESVTDPKQLASIAEQSTIEKPRKRTNTLLANILERTQIKRRPRSLSLTLAQCQSSH